MKPERIQRKRTAGWQMPENTVYVGRPSRWGNRFLIGMWVDQKTLETALYQEKPHYIEITTYQQAVNLFAQDLMPYSHRGPNSSLEKFYISEANLTEIQNDLRGKNLACWCRHGQPCHADWLLEIANG